MVLVRQRPGTANGVVFITLEDETGIANLVVWPAVMEKFRKEVMGARLLWVEGKIQASPEGVVHLVAERLVDRSGEMARLSDELIAPRSGTARERAAQRRPPRSPRSPRPSNSATRATSASCRRRGIFTNTTPSC